MSDNTTIKVWRFDDAPKELQELSPHCGDEDWIALVPPALIHEHISWLQPFTPFGCCDVSDHRLEDGSVVYIGAHS